LRFFNGAIHDRFKNEQLYKLDIPYKKIGNELNLITGPILRLNFLAVSPYANHLYLCTLGQDCTPGSLMMNRYCLGIQELKKNPAACEKDLISFFTEDYLSPNQLQDALNLYEQLVMIYAP